jgi:hypothetical protein
MKRLAVAAALLAAGCKVDPPAEKPAAPTSAAPATKAAPTSAAATAPAPAGSLPPSDRVWMLKMAAAGGDHVVGADGDAIWLSPPLREGKAEVRWRRQGPGVAQDVAFGDLGQGPRLFVAWGVGRGHLDAPLVLESIDPATGEATEIWRHKGERNECAHLSIADVDGDGKAELAFAYYASKYFVKARHFRANGEPLEGAEVRMATSRAFADLDGDRKLDEVVGRVYGDDKGLPGDLKADLGRGPVPVPAENGVRSLAVAAVGDEKQPSLYFADGWVANYGKEAKARLKRARWTDGRFAVETLGESPDEFTFFALTPVDVDGDGRNEIAAQGDKRVSLFWPAADGKWTSRPLAAIEPVLNTAIGRDAAGGWVLLVPARPATRVVPVR